MKIKKQAALVSRAIICWRAYRNSDKTKKLLIVKDSWQYEERPEVGLLIREATNGGVENIARYRYHETVRVHGEIDDTLENVRGGLMKECGRTSFWQKAFKKPGATAPSLKGKPRFQSQEQEKPLHNRFHRRIVTRDAGKDVYEAKSLRGIINGFLRAIHGHESLLSAGILHRDISRGNIILIENKDDGFLINLDLAIRTSNNNASGAPSKTALKSLWPLERSLIYIHYDGLDEKSKVKRRIVPEYEKWNYVGIEEFSEVQRRGNIEAYFDNIDKNFVEYCKPLVPYIRNLYKVVSLDGSSWLTEHQELYSDMKRVLEKTRNGVGP